MTFKPFNWDYFFDQSVQVFRKKATEADKSTKFQLRNKEMIDVATSMVGFDLFHRSDCYLADNKYEMGTINIQMPQWWHRINRRTWFGINVSASITLDDGPIIREHHFDDPSVDRYISLCFSYRLKIAFHQDWVKRLMGLSTGIPPMMQAALAKYSGVLDCQSAYEGVARADKHATDDITAVIVKGYESIIDAQVEEFFKACDLERYVEALRDGKTKCYG